jgi:DNA-directed RNA polymerase specialized sigma24 family protein
MEISLPEEFKYEKLKFSEVVELLITTESEVEGLQNEFFLRVKDKFLDRCQKVVQRLYNNNAEWEAIRDDVFQETFITVFSKINKFKTKSSWNEKEYEKVILFWMSEIANRKLLKQIKFADNENDEIEKYLYFKDSEESAGTVGKLYYKPTYDRNKFDKIWEKMNPMSKELLLLCIEYGTITDDNSKHLPDNIIANLRNKYNVSAAALRQAKSRAIIAIKSCKI